MTRRDRYHQQFARLNGSEDPKRAIAAGLCVGGSAMVDSLILAHCERTEPFIHAFVAPIGSGKSTAMLVAAEALQTQVPWALAIDVSLTIHLCDLSTTYSLVDLILLLNLPIPVAGSPAPLLFLDSLDRLRDAYTLGAIFRDLEELRRRGYGVVVAVPPWAAALEGEKLRDFKGATSSSDLPDGCSDPRQLCDFWDTNFQPDLDFLAAVLAARVDPAWVSPEHQDMLVQAAEESGGIVRDLIDLARNAVEEAYLKGRESVSEEDVRVSIHRLARAQSLYKEAAP